MRNPRWVLIAIFIVALIIRLAWVLRLPVSADYLERLPDQREYLELGRNLLAGEGLKFFDPRFDDTVYAYRMPGYPLLIALCQANIRVVRIVQALIDSSSILGVWLLARRAPEPGRLLAALLIAFNPFLIYFSGLLLTETLFAGMLIWGIVLLGAMQHRSVWWIGAVVLALSVLVRPSAIALPVVLAVLAAIVNRRSVLLAGAVTLGMTFLVLFPWAWRNHWVLGKWVWTTTNSGITLYDGFNPTATGASDQSFTRNMPQLNEMNEVGRSDYFRSLAWRFIRENPGNIIRLAAVKIARTWSPIPLSREYGGDAKLVAVALAYMVPYYVLIILGLWNRSLPGSAKALLLAPAVYFTAVHAISVGSLRYRVPADVPMAVLAGFAVRWRLLERTKADVKR